jgi:hypothetical protein
MTLGNMRANGVRSLLVSCWTMPSRSGAERRSVARRLPVPTFGPRMVCSRAGGVVIVGATAAGKLPAALVPFFRLMVQPTGPTEEMNRPSAVPDSRQPPLVS